MVDLNNEKGAYFLGWMYSDGCVYKEKRTKNSYVIKLKIIASDEKVLNNFMHITEWSKTYEMNKRYVCIRKTNTDLAESLIYYGVLPRKSYENSLELLLPKIDNIYIPYFIRGLFEGDGYISMHSKTAMIVALCGRNKNLFEEIQKYLLEFNIESKLYFKKNKYQGMYKLIVQKPLLDQ